MIRPLAVRPSARQTESKAGVARLNPGHEAGEAEPSLHPLHRHRAADQVEIS
jgi:hypothetical protein